MTTAHPLSDARHLFAQALRACSVERALEQKLTVRTRAGRTTLSCDDQEVDLSGLRHLRIVAVGKAASPLLQGFLRRVPFAGDLRGVLIAPSRPRHLPPGIRFFAGGHPLPNQASFDAAEAALALIAEASRLPHALCIFLISGGASAMMELPLDRGISLYQTVEFHRVLVHSGATISEINCIRKHFSAVKGGRLAQAAGDTPCLTLVVSDVAPRHLDALGSGPTMPDSSTVAHCRELLARYRLQQVLPPAIRDFFASPTLQETPKPGTIEPRIAVLLDSNDLSRAAAQAANELGYHVVVDDTCDDWPCHEAAAYLVQRLRQIRERHEKVCLLSTGEITVAVPAACSGSRGGRNQHFALYAATLLEPSDTSVAILSAGSDGIDGNSDAAGAVVGLHLLDDTAPDALRRFDSSTWLAARGATIVTGPTGNNLRDLRILLAGPAAHDLPRCAP